MPPLHQPYGLPLWVQAMMKEKAGLERCYPEGRCPKPRSEPSSRHLPHRFAACREAGGTKNLRFLVVAEKAPTFPFYIHKRGFHETLGHALKKKPTG